MSGPVKLPREITLELHWVITEESLSNYYVLYVKQIVHGDMEIHNKVFFEGAPLVNG